jgi:aerobic carbon-monoxide dehydrogenase small subunit
MENIFPISLKINNQRVNCRVEPRQNLVDFLRYDRGLTGTHVGCEHGVCGACTVLVDGRSVRACLMLAVQADGTELRTVESLGTPNELSPLQQAFSDCHGLQCGFCTPGFLMTITEFLENRESDCITTEEDIRQMLSGNVCRCTGYQGIVEAVQQVLNTPKVIAR